MSYILEALKKSEQERERESGALPDIKSVHTPSASSSCENRSWWPFLLIVVVVSLSAGGVYYYLTGSDLGQGDLTVAQNSVTQEPQTKSDNGQMTENKSVLSKKESTATVASPVTPTVTSRTAKPENGANSSLKQQKPKVIFSKEQLQQDNVIGNVAEQQEKAKIRTLGQGKGQSKVQSREQTKKIAVKQPVQSISDIPDSVRKKIPSIAFEGHVYSSIPERRSVMINGHKMREGEAISGDLLLKEITALGAEFEYEGYRFRLNALQDWSFH